MQTTLAPLTLRPEPAEPHFQLGHFRQRLGIQLPNAGPAVLADGPLLFRGGDERFLAAHAGLGFFGEFHQTTEGGSGDGDGAGVFAREELACFLLAEDGIKDSAQGLRELIIEIILRVNRDIVLEHEDGIFTALVVFGATGAFDDNIGNAVAKRGSGTSVAFLHALGKFGMGLFTNVVSFREGFCDDEFGHVDLVLEEVGDGVFDVALRDVS